MKLARNALSLPTQSGDEGSADQSECRKSRSKKFKQLLN